MDNQLHVLVLDQDPVLCAQAYADADLGNWAYEYAQCLEVAYLAQHGGPVPKHVLAKWAMGEDAWWWLFRLTREMLLEQWHRFGDNDDDTRLTLSLLIHEDDNGPKTRTPRFVQLIPRKIPGRAVEAYREWYHQEASPCWTKRGAPEWWQGPEQTTLF